MKQRKSAINSVGWQHTIDHSKTNKTQDSRFCSTASHHSSVEKGNKKKKGGGEWNTLNRETKERKYPKITGGGIIKATVKSKCLWGFRGKILFFNGETQNTKPWKNKKYKNTNMWINEGWKRKLYIKKEQGTHSTPPHPTISILCLIKRSGKARPVWHAIAARDSNLLHTCMIIMRL